MHLLTPKGFRAGAVAAGIKSNRKLDVAMLVCDTRASAAAVFTTNKVVAAPVIVAQGNLRESLGFVRGVVVNAGNANACTGARGMRDANTMCALAAKQIDCSSRQFLPCSTGIIGHAMPMQKVSRGVVQAATKLGSSATHARQFADAILTTDTKRKTAAVQVRVGREVITIAGVCKGAGMIGPRMASHATMLAFLTTDAALSPSQLQRSFGPACDRSFNAVTIDDHTSTNDTAILLASGKVKLLSKTELNQFETALNAVCQSLAYQIAADGEGATKVVRINVMRARNDADARAIARSIANSPLIKCAMNGNDPNWGRIVSAAGYANAAFDPTRATLTLQRTRVFHRGKPVSFDAAKVSRSLGAREVVVDLDCNMGLSRATVWTCDLSKEYVTINADYHT